jgi:cbb3-type cytochrome oxidase subunit 3
MKKIFIFTVLAASLILTSAPARAAYDFATQSGLDSMANETGHKQQKLFSSPDSIDSSLNSIIAVILSFLGVIFLVLMIYGGITWMIARGNEKEVEEAKKIIIRSVFGLIIVSAAYALTYFVLQVFVAQTLK